MPMKSRRNSICISTCHSGLGTRPREARGSVVIAHAFKRLVESDYLCIDIVLDPSFGNWTKSNQAMIKILFPSLICKQESLAELKKETTLESTLWFFFHLHFYMYMCNIWENTRTTPIFPPPSTNKNPPPLPSLIRTTWPITVQSM